MWRIIKSFFVDIHECKQLRFYFSWAGNSDLYGESKLMLIVTRKVAYQLTEFIVHPLIVACKLYYASLKLKNSGKFTKPLISLWCNFLCLFATLFSFPHQPVEPELFISSFTISKIEFCLLVASLSLALNQLKISYSVFCIPNVPTGIGLAMKHER